MKQDELELYSIVKAGRGSLKVLFPVYEVFLRYYYGRYGSLLRGVTLGKDSIIGYLESKFDDHTSVIFMATTRPAPPVVAGFVWISRLSLPNNDRSVWAIKDLFVLPAHRRKGLALGLIHSACEHCRSEEVESITLLTGKINVEAQGLYEKYGFARDSTYTSKKNVKYDLNIS